MRKDANFVVLDRKVLDDPRLSWGAKGFHSFLVANADDDGAVQEEVLASYFRKSNRDALTFNDELVNLIEELEYAGYISGLEINKE